MCINIFTGSCIQHW